MTLSHKSRRRWALFLLLIWLPIYIGICIGVLGRMPRMPIFFEVIVYIAAAFLWVLPFRFIFRGVGRPDPNGEAPQYVDDELIAKDRAKTREMPKRR